MDRLKASDIFKTLSLVLTAEDKKKLAEVSKAYFETVDENFTLREENSRLRQDLLKKEMQIRKLNDQLEEKQKLILETEGNKAEYFFKTDKNVKIGPVCPLCYTKNGTVSILQVTGEEAFCPVCKHEFAGVEALIKRKYGEAW